MPPEIATKIDNRYEVLGELGRGGMGVVFKANDLKMDRLVAIKVMTAHAPGRDEYQERFLREAKSIARMQHPNIVVVHDFGYHAGAPYIAMEYVEGVPLDKVIASRVSLTLLTKVNFIAQVCQALHYAHQLGIIHRDVKPGNIMVLDGGRRVKLLDFGIARAGAPSNLSKSGLAMGTTCYMSPEQTQGKKDLDARSDIFSAGVVLYELLVGKPPWTGESDYAVMTKIIHEPAPPLAGLSNYPAALDRVLELALAKDPNRRYETAEKLAHALSELEAPLKERAMEEALVQFEHGDLLRANDLVSQILRIDTRHREAVELRARLEQVAQLQQRSEQVRQLRTAAEEAVGQKRYSQALVAVEQAITIDSANTELFHYRELIRNEVKRREDIRKKLELARHAQEMNDLSTAQELVERALEADPTDTQARSMKSSLEQERKRQQLQELAEEASRALTVRAFARVKEFIQQLVSLDPSFAGIVSLKKALAEGEAEEKRRVELENLIGDIRRVLESGEVPHCLSVTQQALARFPGEPRLVRLRAQAEALRDATEREETVQNQLARAKLLVDRGQSAQALAEAEAVLQQLGSEPRLQSLTAQLRRAVEREQQAQAEQAVVAQARNAMQASDFELAVRILGPARASFPNSQEIADALQAAQAGLARKADTAAHQHKLQAAQATLAQAQKLMQSGDFESALKILTPARLDFPDSKPIADALQRAQAAIARKTEMDALHARKLEIAKALDHAIACEPDPELQVRLAEEAVRRIPGNKAAESTLEKVRERHGRIASAAGRARQLEQAQRFAESIQQWEIVRRLWPQCPNLDAQIASLKAAQKASTVTPAPRAAAPNFSATSIMEAPVSGPSANAQATPARVEEPPAPAAQVAGMEPADIESPQAAEIAKTDHGQLEAGQVDVGSPRPQSKKLLLAIAAAAVVVIAAPVAYWLAHTKPNPQPKPETKSGPVVVSVTPAAPEVGTLTVRVNVDPADVFVDNSLRGASEGLEKTLRIIAGNHTIRVEKPGYVTPPQQQIQIAKDQVLNLTFTLTKSSPDAPPPPVDSYLVITTLPGAVVRIDGTDAGKAQPDGSFSLKTTPGSHQVDLSLHGFVSISKGLTVKAGNRRPVSMELRPIPAPLIDFAASESSVQQSGTVELQWKTQGASDVRIDPTIGAVSSQGKQLVTPTPPETTYTLFAKGEGGEVRKSVTVSVKAAPKPTSNFYAGADKIHQGDLGRLIWNTQNATEVYIAADPGPDVGNVPTLGVQEVNPARTTAYTLTAKGAGGEVKQTVKITVEPAQQPVPAPTVAQPAATPVAQPVAPAEDAASKAVLGTMRHFQDLYETMDIDGLKQIWQMPKATEKQLRETFRIARAIKLNMSCKNPIVNGDSAEVTCPQNPLVIIGQEHQSAGSITQVFKLQKTEKGNWQIVSVR